MDISLLVYKEGEWVYGSADQHALVGECAALLNWDLHPFDRWLFDSQNWSMYTRRRQELISLRTELAMAYGKATEPSARALLIVGYCMNAWKSTRALERRDCPEIREMEYANRRARALHKTLKPGPSVRKAPHSRSSNLGSHLQLHTVAQGH